MVLCKAEGCLEWEESYRVCVLGVLLPPYSGFRCVTCVSVVLKIMRSLRSTRRGTMTPS